MSAARELPPDPRQIDQRVYLTGRTWEDFQAFMHARGESSALRVTYLKGTIEIMAPSKHHELDKTKLARLLEAWAEELDIELEGYGSFTVEKREADRAAEADESYVLGGRTEVTYPDIVIEVVWTSGGLDKLEVWRKLGAREVWFWERGALSFHALRGEHYEEIGRSELLPDLDVSLLVECMGERTQLRAVKRLRAAMRA